LNAVGMTVPELVIQMASVSRCALLLREDLLNAGI